ncbi:hypothetical protein [Salinigranum marinum]|uniref:hypothetical protein n=1 Tax=Salinigranum marinum TaxID=1515595 RepID=UPI002989ABF1|nr:hypothetical protein [Salinigranum marinum]
MSLQLGRALKRGAGLLVSRAGAVVLAAYAATMLVYQLSFNTLLQPLLAGLTPPGVGSATPGLVTLPVPGVVAGGLAALALLTAAVISVVAIRTFVAGERAHVPRRFLTERMPFAVVNVVVGGIAFALVVGLGTLLLVVPGIVAYVGLLFMVQFVAVENVNFLTAMRRSWRLTKGNRIRLFLLVVVLLVAIVVATFVVSFGLGFVLASGSGGLAGVVVAMVNVVATLYLLAVLSDAFVQLRDGIDPSRGTRPTTDALGV